MSDLKSSLRKQARVDYSEKKLKMSDGETSTATKVDMVAEPISTSKEAEVEIPSEGQVTDLQKKLDEARLRQAELQKKTDFDVMRKELEELEAQNSSLSKNILSTKPAAPVPKPAKERKSKKKKKSDAGQLTTKSLRSMDTLQRKVDKMMDGTVGNQFAKEDTEDSGS